jgi:hypothetical protein
MAATFYRITYYFLPENNVSKQFVGKIYHFIEIAQSLWEIAQCGKM